MGLAKTPNPIDQYVGGRVKMRRAMLGVSQEKLGSQLGVSFQQVQKYEKGANRIGASRLQEIARLLKVNVSYFYEGLPQEEAAQSGGFAEESAPPLAPDINVTVEGMRLYQAFSRIRDPKIRKQILALVVSLAPAAGKDEAAAPAPKHRLEMGEKP
jgi:transcriptional regulator with XRE-family HTH domain